MDWVVTACPHIRDLNAGGGYARRRSQAVGATALLATAVTRSAAPAHVASWKSPVFRK